MRTNISIDDKLMEQALKSGGYRTRISAIEDGLRLLVQMNSLKKLRTLRGRYTGKMIWKKWERIEKAIVDASAWIEYLKNGESTVIENVEQSLEKELVEIGDLIHFE